VAIEPPKKLKAPMSRNSGKNTSQPIQTSNMQTPNEVTPSLSLANAVTENQSAANPQHLDASQPKIIMSAANVGNSNVTLHIPRRKNKALNTAAQTTQTAQSNSASSVQSNVAVKSEKTQLRPTLVDVTLNQNNKQSESPNQVVSKPTPIQLSIAAQLAAESNLLKRKAAPTADEPVNILKPKRRAIVAQKNCEVSSK